MGVCALDDDDKITRRDPPETPEDWGFLWHGANNGHKAWKTVEPVAMLAKNWKFIVGCVVVAAWLNKPEIIAAIQTLAGSGK